MASLIEQINEAGKEWCESRFTHHMNTMMARLRVGKFQPGQLRLGPMTYEEAYYVASRLDKEGVPMKPVLVAEEWFVDVTYIPPMDTSKKITALFDEARRGDATPPDRFDVLFYFRVCRASDMGVKAKVHEYLKRKGFPVKDGPDGLTFQLAREPGRQDVPRNLVFGLWNRTQHFSQIFSLDCPDKASAEYIAHFFSVRLLDARVVNLSSPDPTDVWKVQLDIPIVIQ